MFYTIEIFTRPKTAEFFNSTPAGIKLAVPSPSKTSQLGTLISKSNTNTTQSITVIRKWVDKPSYDAFNAVKADIITARDSARAVYNAANNITISKAEFTSADLLF